MNLPLMITMIVLKTASTKFNLKELIERAREGKKME